MAEDTAATGDGLGEGDGDDQGLTRERARKDAILDSVRCLLEHEFGAVVLLASYVAEDGATETAVRCDGNWHAQNGMVDHFLRTRRLASREDHDRYMGREGDAPE